MNEWDGKERFARVGEGRSDRRANPPVTIKSLNGPFPLPNPSKKGHKQTESQSAQNSKSVYSIINPPKILSQFAVSNASRTLEDGIGRSPPTLTSSPPLISEFETSRWAHHSTLIRSKCSALDSPPKSVADWTQLPSAPKVLVFDGRSKREGPLGFWQGRPPLFPSAFGSVYSQRCGNPQNGKPVGHKPRKANNSESAGPQATRAINHFGRGAYFDGF